MEAINKVNLRKWAVKGSVTDKLQNARDYCMEQASKETNAIYATDYYEAANRIEKLLYPSR